MFSKFVCDSTTSIVVGVVIGIGDRLLKLRLDVGFWFVVDDLAGDVLYVLLLLLFGVVVVGEGVDIMYVDSGVDH